jgi:predicted ATPase
VKGRKDATEEIPKPEKDRHGPAHESTIVSDGGREVAILAAAADDPSHLAHLEDIVRRAGEQPVNGDVGSVSFHALFPTVAAAIGAALQAQIDTDRALRLAIHMARTDPFVSGCRAEDLEHANVLLSSVPAGEIIISSAAAVPDPKRQPFPSGISLRSLGYHRLADLGSAETLYQALHPHHIRTAPVLRTLDSVRNNLPSQSEPLIGREQALNQIATAIAHPETRVLTLTGPAGTGKTRLALHAAARSTHLFEDGVFLVDLAPISDPRDLGRIIAATLEIRESMGKPRSHGAILTDYLRTRNLLLVLDNFEHLLPAANTIAQLLATAPGVKALVTSRQKLEISVEHEYRVPPLTLPQPMADLEMLFRSESVRLFLSRAVVSRPEIALDPHTVRAIGEICIRLDGLPLAIELAAARLNVVSPADLAAMLPQRLGLLKTQTRDRPHRQQTLQRAIDWSYDLLDEPERRLFANVSVFVGGWTLEAAEVVCSLTGLSDESFDVLEGISSLVNKNLIRMAKHSRDSRFSMLETIREYALLKFNASPNTNLIRQKHAEYFLGLAEQAEPHLHGPNQMEWFDRLESDYENFQVALKWYVDTHKRYEATRICISLEWYWYRYAHLGDGKAWLRTILAPDIGGEEPASNSMVLGAVSPEEEIERTRATGRALRALGWILLVQGDWSSARDRYVESLRIARVTGDRRNESLALSGLGTAERWLGETADGMAHVEASVQLARDLRDPLLIELALIWAYSTTGGKFTGPPPINELKEALELSRRLGDLWSEAHTFNGLGDLYTQMGDYKAARTNYERALQSFRELKDRWLIAWNLEGLARVAILDSDFQSACRTVQESIQLFDELGDQANAVFMLGWLGTAFHQAGNDASAACFFGAFHSFEPTMPISAEFAPANKTVAAASAASRAAATESWEAGYAMSYDQALAFAVAECASLTRQLTP